MAEILIEYYDLFIEASQNFFLYFLNEVTFNVTPWYINYFWWLILLSLFVWALEILFPWRKDQSIIRKDFWLDTFYMFFNFFLFKIIIFFAFSCIIERLLSDLVGGLDKLVIYDTSPLNPFLQLFIFFILIDFIQWVTHILLHRIKVLWRFHKVHHSVEQLGFSAHFRMHWMENVIYTPMKFMMMMVIGNFNPQHAYIVYYFSIAIGHLNHSNINLSYGPLKYILNNPKMHIWHHSYHLPENKKNGINFGQSLSIWDYLFKTAYIPSDGRDIKLGFKNVEIFPTGFFNQITYGFFKTKNKS